MAILSQKQVMIEYSKIYTLKRFIISVKAFGNISLRDLNVIGVFFSSALFSLGFKLDSSRVLRCPSVVLLSKAEYTLPPFSGKALLSSAVPD